MVTNKAFDDFLNGPLTSKDCEIAHRLHMSETPLEKMDTLEFMTFCKVEWSNLKWLFPDLTDEKFDDLLRDHIMDI